MSIKNGDMPIVRLDGKVVECLTLSIGPINKEVGNLPTLLEDWIEITKRDGSIIEDNGSRITVEFKTPSLLANLEEKGDE